MFVWVFLPLQTAYKTAPPSNLPNKVVNAVILINCFNVDIYFTDSSSAQKIAIRSTLKRKSIAVAS